MEYNSSYKSAVLGSLRSAASSLNSCKSVNITIPGDFEGAGILRSALNTLKSVNISGIISEVNSAAVGFEAAERAVEGGMLDFSILFGSFLGSNTSSQPTRPDTTKSSLKLEKTNRSRSTRNSSDSKQKIETIQKQVDESMKEYNKENEDGENFMDWANRNTTKTGGTNRAEKVQTTEEIQRQVDESMKKYNEEMEKKNIKSGVFGNWWDELWKKANDRTEDARRKTDEAIKRYNEEMEEQNYDDFISWANRNTPKSEEKVNRTSKSNRTTKTDQNNEEIRRETIERSKAESERKKKDESKSDSESTEVSASSGGDNGGVDYDPVGSGYSGATIEKYNNENNRDQLLKDLSILATFKNEYDKNCKYLNDLYKDINKLSELNEKGKNKYENIKKKWNSSIEELNTFTELSNLLYDQLKTALSIQLNDKNISNEKLKQVTYKNITIDDEKTVNKNVKTKDTDLSRIVTNLDKSNQSLENMFNQLSSMQTSDPYINELKNKWNEAKKRLAKKLDSLKKAVEKM